MSANLDLLKELFPRRVMLGVDEVAEVLAVGGKAGSYEQTRRELKEGRIIPGLRKHGGVWRVPLTAVAEALDRMIEITPAPQDKKVRRVRPQASDAGTAYGARGRKPDALRARIAEYVEHSFIVVRAIPVDESIEFAPRQSLHDADRHTRSTYLSRAARSACFWDEVGAKLVALSLSELPAGRLRPKAGLRER
jgi:hypothetical protein